MSLRLYISPDLFKADPPAPPSAGAGQEVDYVQSDTPPPGNLGKTEGGNWKVPKGQVNPKSGQVDDDKAEKEAAQEEMDKDPLKAGEKPPEGSDLKAAEESQDPLKQAEQQEAAAPATAEEGAPPAEGAPEGTPTINEPDKEFPGAKDPELTVKDPQAAFTSTSPEDHAETDSMGHYMHAKVADELGDEKLSQFHREQAKEKVGQGMGPDDEAGEATDEDPSRHGPLHEDLAEKLRAAGMHDDADHHGKQIGGAVEQRVEEAGLAQGTPEQQARKQEGRGLAARQQARDDEKMKQRAESRKKREAGEAKTEAQPAAERPDSPESQFQEAHAAQQEKDAAAADQADAQKVAGKYAEAASAQADAGEKKQAEDEKAGKAKTQISEDSLRSQQMSGQKKAIEDFQAQSQAHEKASAEHKAAGEKYESDLKAHGDAKKEHAAELKGLGQKLKDVKAGKPVKDDKKLKGMKKEMKAVRMEMARHKDSMSPEHEKHKGGIDKAKDAIGKHKEKLSAHEKKMKAHEAKAPKKQKAGEKGGDWESRNSKHVEAGKKLKADHGALKSKGAALGAQHKVLKQASDKYKADHKKQQVGYREKLRGMQEKHDSEKDKVDMAHGKASAAHAKKVESAKGAVDKHRDAKSKLPEKPKKPSSKEPKAPAGRPKDDKEKMAHGEHQAGAKKMRENIESHLRDNPDLDDASRRKMTKLHEQASVHEHTQNVPTPEQKKEMRDLGSRAKEHGADRHHDEVKAEKEQTAAKEQEKAEKQKVKEGKEFDRKRKDADKRVQQERESTPRHPEDEMDRAEVLQHSEAAGSALDNIHSHLENGDIDDDTRTHLEEMASKLESHADLGTVPTTEQKAELKQVQSLTKDHSGKNFHDTPEGKAAGGEGAAPAKKEESSAGKKTAKKTGSNLLRLYNQGSAIGRKIGAAAASPYGGAGSFAETLDYAGRGAAHAGHHLLDNKKKDGAKKPGSQDSPQDLRSSSKENKESDIASRRAKPQEQKLAASLTARPLQLWVRN